METSDDFSFQLQISELHARSTLAQQLTRIKTFNQRTLQLGLAAEELRPELIAHASLRAR